MERSKRLNMISYVVTVICNMQETGNVKFHDFAGKCERALKQVNEGHVLRFNLDQLREHEWTDSYRTYLYEFLRHIDDL